MTPEVRSYESPEALAIALAGLVATELAAVLSRRTRTAFAMPGTWAHPAFDHALLGHGLDWARVHLTTTDAVWRSRDGLAGATGRPMTAHAGPPDVRCTPLDTGAGTPDEAAALAAGTITAHILPLDVCVLAMGDDGGVAGLVPGGDRLEEAINPVCREPVLPIRAPGDGGVRLTLTLPAIQSAARICLVLSGAAALATLQRATGPGPLNDPPVRALVRAPRPLTVFHVK